MIKRIKLVYTLFCRLIFGIKKNKVLFISFDGKSYSDNPRAISEELHLVYSDAKIYWILSKEASTKSKLPKYVKCVVIRNRFSVLKYYYHLATSKVFVSNFSLTYVHKSKKQCFISTWHGDKAFKKVLLDAGTERFVTESIPGYCNLAICGSKYGQKQWESAFHFYGPFYDKGTPRNDLLVRNSSSEKSKIKRELGLSEKRALLFAPTLRTNAPCDGCLCENDLLINPNELKEILEKKTGDDWVFLIRKHPSMEKETSLFSSNDIVDVSSVDDMATLLLISDILITDYSSCAGDFALTGGLIVLYQPDRSTYLKYEREFYFDIDQSPYHVAKGYEELKALIKDYDEKEARDNCKQILDYYCSNESGNASKDISNYIVSFLKNGEKK